MSILDAIQDDVLQIAYSVTAQVKVNSVTFCVRVDCVIFYTISPERSGASLRILTGCTF